MRSDLLFPPGNVNNINALTCRDGANNDLRNVLTLYPEGCPPTRINAYRVAGLSWDVPILGAAPQVAEERVKAIFATQGRVLDTFSVWVQSIRQGPASTLDDLPPAIQLDLRLGWNAVTTLAVTALILPPNWNQGALAFQFSGIPATRFELWAGTFDGGVNRPARVVNVTWACLVSYKGCCEQTLIPGEWELVIP